MTNDELIQEVESLKTARDEATLVRKTMTELIQTLTSHVIELKEKYETLSTEADRDTDYFVNIAKKLELARGVSSAHFAAIASLMLPLLSNNDLHQKGFDGMLKLQVDALSAQLDGFAKQSFDSQIEVVQRLLRQIS